MKHSKDPSYVYLLADSLATAGDSAIDWWSRNDRSSRCVEVGREMPMNVLDPSDQLLYKS